MACACLYALAIEVYKQFLCGEKKGGNFSFWHSFPINVSSHVWTISCNNSAYSLYLFAFIFQLSVRPFFLFFLSLFSMDICFLLPHPLLILFFLLFISTLCCDFDAISMTKGFCDVFIACTLHAPRVKQSESIYLYMDMGRICGEKKTHAILTHIHAVLRSPRF